MRLACNAILKHREQVIKWPSIKERRNISGRIRKAHGFVNCIGLIDGTLFPQAFAPIVNGEDYYTRKGDYVIKGLVIFDDAARITWVELDQDDQLNQSVERRDVDTRQNQVFAYMLEGRQL